MIDISILSISSALVFLKRNQRIYDVILALAPNEEVPKEIHDSARSVFCVRFHHVDCVLEGFLAPNENHVSNILSYVSPDKYHILCCCYNGIFSSSAIAYMLACASTGNAEVALSVLSQQHRPNKLIVSLAAKVLQKPEIFTTYLRWMEK